MQRFNKRFMFIEKFFLSDGCHAELPVNSNQIINIKKDDKYYLLCNLTAYLHLPKNNAN